MSNRFHNKFHRHNHHTLPTDREGLYPDSAYDPIASPEVPFQGSFNLSGNFVCLSSAFIRDKITCPYAEFGDVLITEDLTVLGETTKLDTYVFCYSAVDINCSGPFTSFNVTNNANQKIAKFTNYYNNNIVIDADCQIGIGTTNPEAQIHIIETDSAKTSKIFVDNLFSNSLIRLKAPVLSDLQFANPYGTYANIIGTAALSSLTFKTKSLERVTVTSNGDVGIATNTPAVRLDVIGNTRIITNNSTSNFGTLTIVKPNSAYASNDLVVETYASFPGQNISSSGGLKIKSAGGTYETSTATLSGKLGYVIGSSTHNGIDWKDSSAINLGIETNASINNHNSYIAFETLLGGYADNLTEKMRIVSNGNVGIGTTSPQNSNGYTSLTINNSVSGGRIDLQKNNTRFGTIYSSDANMFDIEAVGVSTVLKFNTNSLERMRVASNGNVGIGTINPGHPLDVVGFARVQGGKILLTPGENSTHIFGDEHNLALRPPNGGYVIFQSNNGDVTWFASGSADTYIDRQLVIKGKSDLAELAVHGYENYVAGMQIVHLSANETTSKIAVWDTSNENGQRVATMQHEVETEGGGNIKFFTSSSGDRTSDRRIERMKIAADGNIGIGTNEPNTNLTVVGNISAQGTRVDLYNLSTNSVIKAQSTQGASFLELDTYEPVQQSSVNFQLSSVTFARIRSLPLVSAVVIESNNTERLRIDENGADITGNLTVRGDLSSTGNQYFTNTFFSTTSSISVVNISPTSDIPALYIAQSGPGDIASFYDLDEGIEVLHVGGANGTYPNVGIKNSEPNKDFTVKGEISASGTIWDSIGNSNLWNSVFSIVQSLSASWQGIGQLYANTEQLSISSTIILSQTSTDIELIPSETNVTEITAFNGGVKGITYTLTNKTFERITIYSSPNIIIRRGNAWISNTTTLSGAYLVLPLSGSCSVRVGDDFVSLW